MRRGTSPMGRSRRRAAAGPRPPLTVSERLARGCLLPTEEGIIRAAICELRNRSDEVQPQSVGVARASSVSAKGQYNSVPERVIADSIASDPTYKYLQHYVTAAERALEDCGLSDREIWQGIIDQYWKHLRAVVGDALMLPTPAAGGADPSLHILLRPTLCAKPLAPAPFKGSSHASLFATTIKGLREALHRVQQYVFFMRPEDPSAPSEDTARRLDELLAYTTTLYRWAEWLLWTTDKHVIHQLCPTRADDICRHQHAPPSEMLEQHFKQFSDTTAADTQYMVLRAAICGSFGNIRRLAGLWETGKRRTSACGTADAIVAAIEVLSLVHHHAQYILNATLVGYVVWADGCLENRRLLAAASAQDRFCRMAAPIFHATTTASWARMEVSMQAWFTAALACRMFTGGWPTPHYERAIATVAPANHPGQGGGGGDDECCYASMARGRANARGPQAGPAHDRRRMYVRPDPAPPRPPRDGALFPGRRDEDDPYMLPYDAITTYANVLPRARREGAGGAAPPGYRRRDRESDPYEEETEEDTRYVGQNHGAHRHALSGDPDDATYADPDGMIPPLRAAPQARAPLVPAGHPRHGPHRHRSGVVLPGDTANLDALSAMVSKMAMEGRAARR
ncbi:UL46 tegument protein VP11/12 [Leporid alphaherpesvirus 4]|uniref:UL46 tegument protein VP11/12 n=1 Tax=Leporid alphaherpesvirus 4 TaxID=481315 RepID=J9QWM4_9ALPH|nr:UL46 tegument protein VP11/12 [Leporid alphaherpesvirus 4]AFR32489.1 UL46 tegument protein VP11/12 [Leporid alphaherpesvirus 4]